METTKLMDVLGINASAYTTGAYLTQEALEKIVNRIQELEAQVKNRPTKTREKKEDPKAIFAAMARKIINKKSIKNMNNVLVTKEYAYITDFKTAVRLKIGHEIEGLQSVQDYNKTSHVTASSEYPDAIPIPDIPKTHMPKEVIQLIKTLDKNLPKCDELRYFMAGYNLKITPESITVQHTDNRHAYTQTIKTDTQQEGTYDVFLPYQRIIQQIPDSDYMLCVDEKHIHLENANFVISIFRNRVTYPNIDNVIPKMEKYHTVTLNTEYLTKIKDLVKHTKTRSLYYQENYLYAFTKNDIVYKTHTPGLFPVPVKIAPQYLISMLNLCTILQINAEYTAGAAYHPQRHSFLAQADNVQYIVAPMSYSRSAPDIGQAIEL